MGEQLYDTLESLFAGSLITDIAGFIQDTLDATESFFDSSQITVMLNLLIVIGGTLVTLFFFMDLMDKSTKEMLTAERFLLSLIRYVLVMLVLIYLQDIIVGMFRVTSALYDLLADSVSLGDGSGRSPFAGVLEFFPDDGNPNPDTWPAYSDVEAAFEAAGYKSKITSYISNLGLWVLCIAINLIMWLAKVVAFLIALTTAISLIARAIGSPLGVVQMFEDGTRSAGFAYFKKFLADGLTFFAIMALLYASSLIQSNLIAIQAADVLNGALSVEAIDELFSFSNGGMIVSIFAVQLSTIGAMFKANGLAKDIVGTH